MYALGGYDPARHGSPSWSISGRGTAKTREEFEQQRIQHREYLLSAGLIDESGGNVHTIDRVAAAEINARQAAARNADFGTPVSKPSTVVSVRNKKAPLTTETAPVIMQAGLPLPLMIGLGVALLLILKR